MNWFKIVFSDVKQYIEISYLRLFMKYCYYKIQIFFQLCINNDMKCFDRFDCFGKKRKVYYF